MRKIEPEVVGWRALTGPVMCPECKKSDDLRITSSGCMDWDVAECLACGWGNPKNGKGLVGTTWDLLYSDGTPAGPVD